MGCESHPWRAVASLLTGSRSEDPTLAETLNSAFRERMIEVMDQSQHTSADSGGEGAAYEFCQALDTWEKERTFASRLGALGTC